jgi:hypothetical protein
MADFRAARWYTIRPAQSRQPRTYRCPLCGRPLHAMSEHFLVMPEGDPVRRRHVHGHCVLQARKGGRMPLREDVEPRRPSWLARVLRRSAD